MRNTLNLVVAALFGCIDNTKLTNNIQLDSGARGGDSSSTVQPDEHEKSILISVDTTLGQISQIDPINGYTIPIGHITTDYQITSVAFNQEGVGYVYEHINRKIGIIKPCSGELNLLPTANEDNVICGISFGPDGSLYGLDSKNNQLVTYDLETGASSSIGPLNMNIRACGLAYDSTADRLIGVTASTGEVFHIDRETGTTFDHLPTNVPFEGVGAEYVQTTDSLLVSTGNRLYSIDLSDGESTFRGEMEGHIDDLVFHSECP